MGIWRGEEGMCNITIGHYNLSAQSALKLPFAADTRVSFS